MPAVDVPTPSTSRANPDVHLERFRRTQRTFLSQFESRSPQRLHTLRWPDDGRPGRERSPGPFAQRLPALKWTHEPKWRSSSFASRVVLESRLPISASTPDLLGGSTASRLRLSGALEVDQQPRPSASSTLPDVGEGAGLVDGDPIPADKCEPRLVGTKGLSLEHRLASDMKRLFTVDVLFESLESGAIAPLRGSWVAALQKRGEILPKRKDLPPEALFSMEHLRRLVSALGPDYGYLFVALSYRHLSAAHPDPDGFVLAIVAQVCRLYLKPKDDTSRAPRPKFPFDGPAPTNYSPLLEAFERNDLSGPDFVLFWDYASLHPAASKVPSERALHTLGVRAAAVWYAHAHTVTWLCTEMPRPVPVASPTGIVVFGANAAVEEEPPPPHGETAWTAAEMALSGAGLKPRHLRLDLSKRTEVAMKTAYGGRTVHGSWPADCRLDVTCSAPHTPLAPPRDFEYGLVGGRNKKGLWAAVQEDKETIAKLYAAIFDAVARSARSLDFSGQGWGPTEAAALSSTLPLLTALTDLNLSKSLFDDAAASAIASGVGGMKSIKHLRFNKNRGASGSGALALADAVLRCRTLRTFSGLPLHEIRHHRLEIAQANERRNSRRPSVAAVPAAPLAPIGQHLVDLNLAYSGLGTAEALILADVIGAGAGLDHDFLRSVNVAGNIDILGEGVRRLTDAVLQSEKLEAFSKLPVKLLKQDESIVGLDVSHGTSSFFSRLQFVPHFDRDELLRCHPVLARLAEETFAHGASSPRLGLVEASVLAPLLRASQLLRSLNMAGNELDDDAGYMIGMAAAEGAPSLVELDLRFNELAEKTKKAVRSAINARNAKLIARGIKVWDEDEPHLRYHL